MKFKKFFYKKVNSTNDLAARKIKFGFTKWYNYFRISKKEEEDNLEKNGFHLKEICLCHDIF